MWSLFTSAAAVWELKFSTADHVKLQIQERYFVQKNESWQQLLVYLLFKQNLFISLFPIKPSNLKVTQALSSNL